MISTISQIQKRLSVLPDSIFQILSTNYNCRYEFSNERLQKEIGIEFLKTEFQAFFQKTKDFSKLDTMTLKKIIKLSRKYNQSLPEVISNNYDSLKHLVKIETETLPIFLLKILYLLEHQQITTNTIESDIKRFEEIHMLDESKKDFYDILALVNSNKKFKLPKRRFNKNKKITLKKQESYHIDKNTIYKKFLDKKKSIFQDIDEKEEEQNIYFNNHDKKLLMEFKKLNNHKPTIYDDKFHIYVYYDSKHINKITLFLDFIFELKKATYGKIDDIIKNTLFCLFDDYHTHIEYMLQQDKKFSIPFKYESDDIVYVVQQTFINILIGIKTHKYINEIIEYYLEYLDHKDIIDNFIAIDENFYFANFKGLLNLLNYSPKNSQIVNKMFQSFTKSKYQEKKNKTIENKYKQFLKFKHLIDFNNINWDNIPKNSYYTRLQNIDPKIKQYFTSDKTTINDVKQLLNTRIKNLENKLEEDEFYMNDYNTQIQHLNTELELVDNIQEEIINVGETMIEIEILIEQMKLKNYLFNHYPRNWERKLKRLLRNDIKTFYQYRNSEFFKEIKEVEIKEQKTKKIKRINVEQFYQTELDTISFTSSSTKKETFQDKLKHLQTIVDIINFKTLFGLTVDHAKETTHQLEKMILQLDTNNKNIMMADLLQSNYQVLEIQMKNEMNIDKKSKMKQELKQMKIKIENFKSQIQDVDENGYKFGTNFEKEYQGNTFITSDIINQTKKMKTMMGMIDNMTKLKTENSHFLNTFTINMLQNFENVNNQLYEKFNLYINHNIDTIFSNYVQKFNKNIKQDLETIDKHKLNKMAYDVSRAMIIIFFILENEPDINSFYRKQEIITPIEYIGKYVKYNDHFGKVVEYMNEKLYIQFKHDIEILDKNLVEIVPTLVNRDVYIIKGNYKGNIARIYKQQGNKISLTIDTYGKSESSLSTKIKTVHLDLSYIKPVKPFKVFNINGERKRFYLQHDERDIEYKTIVEPIDIEIKDLFSITRFLFQHLTTNIKLENTYIESDFIKIYQIALSHVNQIILNNQRKILDLKDLKQKKDPNFDKKKKQYETEGLIDMNLRETIFRTNKKSSGIKVLNDNSLQYLKKVQEQKDKESEVRKLQSEIENEENLVREQELKILENKSNNILDFFNSLSWF